MRERRLTAFYIDALASGLLVNILILLLGEIGWYIGVPLNIAYMLLRDALPNGQSLGKKIVKLQVIDNQGQSLSGQMGKACLRSFPLIPPMWLIEAIRLVLNKKRYGDMWAETSVRKV